MQILTLYAEFFMIYFIKYREGTFKSNNSYLILWLWHILKIDNNDEKKYSK